MGQAPEMQSFPVMSGDKVVCEFTVRDNADAIVDLTGGSGRFAMARTPSDAPVIDSAASPATASVSLIAPLSGRVNATIEETETDALLGDYYYEMKWTDINGDEAVVARGYMTFAENLT